jgi:multidrug efflux pump subunit AcrB
MLIGVEKDQPEYNFEVDKEKAMQYGVAPAQIVAFMNAALSGKNVGILHTKNSYNQVNIKLQLPDADKTNIEDLKSLKIVNQQGVAIPIGDLVQINKTIKEKVFIVKSKTCYLCNSRNGGSFRKSFYAISSISDSVQNMKVPSGYSIKEEYTQQPELEDNYSIKWDGEWQITYEVFRDLGVAFLVVILIIYMLIVGWFQNFTVPIIMLAAIPLSLIGIVIGHWIMGAYFTATSMIGFIALAGVMVRNSVLLIDFINIRLAEGVPLKQSILEAGAVRTTPILLTAGAVALGAVVILFDPIFQGLPFL